MDAYYIVVRT